MVWFSRPFSSFSFSSFVRRSFHTFTSSTRSRQTPFQSFSDRFRYSSGYRRFSSYVHRIGNAYSEALDKHPYTIQMLQSGFLGGAGDATTQYFEHQWDEEAKIKPRPWDFWRTFACAWFGIYFMGPVGHIWYVKLEEFCVKYCKKKWQMIFTKVCGDTFVFGPVCLWAFFVSVSLMEGTRWDRIQKKLWRDFVPTYLVDYSFWPLVQSINFRYVPVHHQLLVVNLMCYFDDIFLSYVQHNSLPTIFQVIEDYWAKWLDANGYSERVKELELEEQSEEDERREEWKLDYMADKLRSDLLTR
jgi:protein Mpv17